MAKTQLFNFLERAFFLSELSSKDNMPPADEIVEWLISKKEKKRTRRYFLKESIYSGLALTSMPFLPKVIKNVHTDTQIAIIGSGLAGLHAGYIFYKNNLGGSFKIYEASNRIGGRIFTEKLNNNEGTTELGGEFIDSNHLDILNLANEFGIQLLDTKTDPLTPEIFIVEGENYSLEDAIVSFQNIRKKIGKDAKAKDNALVDFDNTSLKEYIDSLDAESWFLKALTSAYTGECGLDAEEQSSLNFISMIGKQRKRKFKIYGESDERYKLQGGNHQICETIADNFKEQIYLNHSLIGIQSKGNGFNLIFDNKKEEVFADYVIMTIPFTILKDIDGIFKLNHITPQKIKCIKELGYGTNGKYFLEIKERTWRNLGYTGGIYGDIIQNGWDSFHMQNNNLGKSVYTIYLGGTKGQEIHNRGGVNYLPELENAFPGIHSAFKGFTTQFNWSNYKFSKGSYNCTKIGQWTSIADYINTPIGNLFFAGEHCSEYFSGFMNGAAETGRKVAELVIKKIRISK